MKSMKVMGIAKTTKRWTPKPKPVQTAKLTGIARARSVGGKAYAKGQMKKR